MIIEIKGVDFENKGAELMLRTILNKINTSLKDVKFTMVPNKHKSPIEKITELGIYPKLWLRKYKVQWGYTANIMPKIIRDQFHRYGLITDAEVDIVLDAEGFTYSDKWGHTKTSHMAKATKKWKKQGTNVILLPQAMGPFEGKRIRRSFKKIAELADMIYARDKYTFKYLMKLTNNASNIKEVPDFTVSIEGQRPISFDKKNFECAIIPNKRMIDKTSSVQRKHYIPFLAACIRSFINNNYNPFFLIHAGKEDKDLCYKVIRELDEKVPIIKEEDPLRIKGIIGSCKTVVSSRYHGLINAFSQGIPAIGTGWSHKYKALFDYYGFPEMLLTPKKSDDEINRVISHIIRNQRKISKQLSHNAVKHKKRVEIMWKDILEKIRDSR